MPLQSRTPSPSLFPAGYRFRLVMMASALVLIGLTIYNLRERARAANAGEVPVAAQPKAKPAGEEGAAWTETIVPGLTDEDALEKDEIRKQFEAIDDGEGLQATDMPAYWRLMKWTRSQSFAELEQRAARDVPFVKLWKEPGEHRGKLIRLRVHIRRVVEWNQKGKNSAGVKTVYEIWGTTDESKSNPYSIAVAELPPEIPADANALSEGVFVGYFLKLLKYSAEDKKERGAPLLIGRVKGVKSGKSVAAVRQEGLLAMVAIGAAILLVALIIVWIWRFTRKTRGTAAALNVPALPTADVEAWLQNSPGEELAAVPSEAAGSGTVPTNGQAKHAVTPPAHDSTDHIE